MGNRFKLVNYYLKSENQYLKSERSVLVRLISLSPESN